MSIASVLVDISILSGLFPLLAALYNYRQLDHVLKLVAVFCLFSAGLDWLSYALAHFGVHNTLFVEHIFDILSVLLFTVIYYKAFYERFFKRIALLLGGMAFIAIVLNTLFYESIWMYPSVSNTVLSLLLIILSLTYFYQLLTRQEFIHIDKQGLFWINAGVLFYFSILIFLFMIYNKISSSAQADFIMIQSITNIISNVLFSVGLLCKPQKTA